jgi:alkaline phosphatase D
MLHPTRRRFITAIGAGIGLGVAGCKTTLVAQPTFSDYPFKLGVASGEPDTDGFVIWTRLAPEPMSQGSLGNLAIPVNWQVATDKNMQNIVQQGEVLAMQDWGHSVHVEVSGLRSGHEYWYQFNSGGEISPVGRAATFPEDPSRLRFAAASCQNYQFGYFGAYEHMIRDQLDFVLFLGDYIYESNDEDPPVRRHVGLEAETLNQYRQRYSQYRLDPHLQKAHAALPWVVMIDDHEVDNDFAGLNNWGDVDKATFARRRAAAYKAFYEFMPLRAAQRPVGADIQLYRGFEVGGLARISMTDLRQYRDNQACRLPGVKPGRPIGEECTERLEEGRTMLGPEQEQWLNDRLAGSGAQWNIIVQNQFITPWEQENNEGEPNWWTDDWNGYPVARERLLNSIQDIGVKNPVFLAGDIHSFWANEIPGDRRNLNSAPIASEFVTGAITSNGPPYDFFMSLMPKNPHVKYYESRLQGYIVCDINRDRWRTDFYAVDREIRENPPRRKLASYELTTGNPAQREVKTTES